jgi:hypothetical protein
VFYQLLRRYDKVKKVHLQQFGIIHFAKFRSNSNSNSSPSQNAIAIFFWQKQKKHSPTVLHLRASPRVFQILLGKSCVLPTSKKVCQVKKRVHLQQFGIIRLKNSDLTYIRNPKRNKIMFMPFHLLETYIRNPSLFFISFFTLPPRGKGL